MNLFVLDKHPVRAAKYHCDRHIVKMPLEATQMLVSAFWLANGVTTLREKKIAEQDARFLRRVFKGFPRTHEDGMPNPWGISHYKHPCTIWVRQCDRNFLWTLELAQALADEYKHRYGKTHAVVPILNWIRKQDIPAPKKSRRSPFAQAMPEQCRNPRDAVSAYRDYYQKFKASFATWKFSETPKWWHS